MAALKQPNVLVASTAAGIAFGLACGLADRLPYSPHLLATVPVWLGNIAGTWLIAAFVAGALSPSLRVAGLATPSLLLSAVLAYYGLILLAGTRAFIPLPALLSTAFLWLLLALLAGLVFGWLGFRWRAGTTRGRLMALFVLALSLLLESLAYLLRAVPSTTNPYFVLYALEFTAGLLLPVALARRPELAAPHPAGAP